MYTNCIMYQIYISHRRLAQAPRRSARPISPATWRMPTGPATAGMAVLTTLLHVCEVRVCLEAYLCDARMLVRMAIASSMQEYLACRAWVMGVWQDYDEFLEWQLDKMREAYVDELCNALFHSPDFVWEVE